MSASRSELGVVRRSGSPIERRLPRADPLGLPLRPSSIEVYSALETASCVLSGRCPVGAAAFPIKQTIVAVTPPQV